MDEVLAFLNGAFFGYFLHAAEMLLAMGLFGIGMERRDHFWWRALITPVIFLAVSIGFGFLAEEYFPPARYLVTFLIALGLFPICFRVDIWDSIFRVLAAAITQNIAFCTSGVVVGLCGWDPVRIEIPQAVVIQTLVYLFVQVGLYVWCRINIKNMDIDFAQERYPLILITGVISVIIYVMELDRRSLATEHYFAWQFLFVCIDGLILCLLLGIFERNKLRKENAILDQLRASEERQYELDRATIETVNIKCHDLKHQLMALRDMQGAERDRAFADVEKAVMIYDRIVQTGCKPLDVLINRKYLLCEKKKIRFTYMVDGEKLSFMAALDIYSLFGNALDNAIHAAQEVQEESQRLINLTVTAHGALLLVHVENSVAQQPRFVNGVPVTTQADTSRHGFGMSSMRRTVEQYGGILSVAYQNHLFSLDMTIPMNDKKNARG